MKKILLPTLCILLSALVIAAVPTEAEAMIYEDTIRLHILASSDSEEDQSLKLALRDALLKEYSTALSLNGSKEEAERELTELLPELEAFVNDFLKNHARTADVQLVKEWYTTRYYEDFTLPRGYYTSLKIVIGEGKGQNWWCVMYPPMCLDAAKGAPVYTESEMGLIAGKYNLKFKLLELLSECSGKNR